MSYVALRGSRIDTDLYLKHRCHLRGFQEQKVKFQNQIFSKFEDNFRTFLLVSRGSRHLCFSHCFSDKSAFTSSHSVLFLHLFRKRKKYCGRQISVWKKYEKNCKKEFLKLFTVVFNEESNISKVAGVHTTLCFKKLFLFAHSYQQMVNSKQTNTSGSRSLPSALACYWSAAAAIVSKDVLVTQKYLAYWLHGLLVMSYSFYYWPLLKSLFSTFSCFDFWCVVQHVL